MSKLLINEHPLQILPKLAVAIGLNEALVLQQMHYWQEKSDILIDEKKWVYNTYEEWQKQFPFWSIRTIKVVFESLKKQELIWIEKHAKNSFDRTNYISINYKKLEEIENKNEIKSEIIDSAESALSDCAESEIIDSAESALSDCAESAQSYIVKSFDRDYTETTTETTIFTVVQNSSNLAPDVQNLKSFEQSQLKIDKKKNSSFKKPTLQEIQNYIEEKNYNINANDFYNFYESKNWFVGKNKMSKWKASLALWHSKSTQISKQFKNTAEKRASAIQNFLDNHFETDEEILTRSKNKNYIEGKIL